MRTGRHRRGWGMRKVLVVAAVVAIGLMVAIPWVTARREDARKALCEKRQIDLTKAMLTYDEAHGKLPGYRNLLAPDQAGVEQPTGWVFPALYFLDLNEDGKPRMPEYRELVRRRGPEGDARGRMPSQYFPALVCPEEAPEGDALALRPNWLSFVANCGQPDAMATPPIPPDWPASGVFFNDFGPDGVVPVPMSLQLIGEGDGANYTLALSENLDAGQWTDSREAQVGFLWAVEPNKVLLINELAGEGNGSTRFARPSSRHVGGVNAVFVGGNSRFLPTEIDGVVYVQLMTSDGRNVKIAGRDEPAPPPYRTP